MYTKLMICGSRSIKDENWIFKQIDEYIESLKASGRLTDITSELEIIHGGASGVDSIADLWAKSHNLKISVVKPEWNIYGRSAGIRRNKIMVDMADYVLILWDGNSRGTKSDIDFAVRANKNPCIKKML
ncbi:MAG: DUF2493 domain-containing protein [Treponema sp.]|nr:DUF2493 domain-containing protein [Treponema sp.]